MAQRIDKVDIDRPVLTKSDALLYPTHVRMRRVHAAVDDGDAHAATEAGTEEGFGLLASGVVIGPRTPRHFRLQAAGVGLRPSAPVLPHVLKA
jgi:hypothetical protein